MKPRLREKLYSRWVGCLLGRDQNPEDVVGTVVLLASEDSDFITGQNIVCEGGWVMY